MASGQIVFHLGLETAQPGLGSDHGRYGIS